MPIPALLIIAGIEGDSGGIYRLDSMEVTAEYYNFLHEFDMNWTIYVRKFDRFPMLFDDVKYVLLGFGGVIPVLEAITIRGGGLGENMIKVNGITLLTSTYRFMSFLPIDRDAVEVIRLYRGDMPARYDGFLSSAMEIEMGDRRYIKLGVPSANGRAAGLYVDYFWPEMLFNENFKWRTWFSVYSRGGFSALAGYNIISIRENLLGNIDSIKYFISRVFTVGASYRRGGFAATITREWRRIYEGFSHSEDMVYNSEKSFSELSYERDGWGAVLQYHRYTFLNDDDSLYRELGARRDYAMVKAYRRIGWLSIGAVYFTQGRILPDIRVHYKRFIDSSRAVKVYFGTTHQGFMDYGFPFFEKVAMRSEVNTAYTFIAGYEEVRRGVSLQGNVFIRYFNPYRMVYALSYYDNPGYVNAGDTSAFPNTPSIAAGVDFTMGDFPVRDFRLSLTIQRAVMLRSGLPIPQDVRYILNINYRFFNAMFMDGPVRSDMDLYNGKIQAVRETPLYIITIAFPFTWKGFHFRVGVYNLDPIYRPINEFSSIYRAFPIPILSVRRDF